MPDTASTPPTPPIQAAPSEHHHNFSRHVYDTHQAIIRQLDTKAGVMVGVLTLLYAGLLPLLKDIPSKLHFCGHGSITSWLFLLSASVATITFLWTAWCVQNVIIPRNGTEALPQGLMYSRQILRHGSPKAYSAAVLNTQADDVLGHMTENIYHLSIIQAQKMTALDNTHWPIRISLLTWATTTVLTLCISSWK